MYPCGTATSAVNHMAFFLSCMDANEQDESWSLQTSYAFGISNSHNESAMLYKLIGGDKTSQSSGLFTHDKEVVGGKIL
jgi:hypothetical protein